MGGSKLKWRLIALLVTGMPVAVNAHEIARPYLVFGSEVEAPRGFVEMCHGDDTFCANEPSGDVGDARLVTAALADGRSTRSASIVSGLVPVERRAARHQSSIVGVLDTRPVQSASLDFAAAEALGVALFAPMRAGADSMSISLAREQPVQATPARIPTLIDTPAIVPSPAPAVSLVGPTSTEGAIRFASNLERINRFVNARVVQRTDLQVYGRAEVWHRSGVGKGAAGDCEDIAIEKRFELIQAGYPKDHLYFAVVYEHSIGLHTVLIARTEQGDYVLDSRTPYIKRWDATPYSFVAVQSMQAPMHWFAPGSAATETAARAEAPSPAAS